MEATKMIRKHYENSILKISKKSAKELFEDHMIDDENDWKSNRRIYFILLEN